MKKKGNEPRKCGKWKGEKERVKSTLFLAPVPQRQHSQQAGVLGLLKSCKETLHLDVGNLETVSSLTSQMVSWCINSPVSSPPFGMT